MRPTHASSYWSIECNKRALQSALICLCTTEPKFSADKITDIFKFSNYKMDEEDPYGSFIAAKGIREFYSSKFGLFDRITEDEQCDGLLVAINHIVKKVDNDQSKKTDLISTIEKMKNRWVSLQDEQIQIQRLVGEGYFSNILANALFPQMAIFKQQYEDSAKNKILEYFFRKKNDRQSNFVTYRYARNKGQISKTKLVILRPSDTIPYYHFRNTYMDSNDVKQLTMGLVLYMNRAVYFFGSPIKGSMDIKMLVLKSIHEGQSFYQGMVLRRTPTGRVLAARILMRAIPNKSRSLDPYDPNKKGFAVGIHSEKDITTEIGDDVKYIRNEIDFCFNRKILYQGEPITEANMVSEVSRLLREKQDITSQPLFTYADNPDEEFNPADLSSYTFNQALLLPHQT